MLIKEKCPPYYTGGVSEAIVEAVRRTRAADAGRNMMRGWKKKVALQTPKYFCDEDGPSVRVPLGDTQEVDDRALWSFCVNKISSNIKNNRADYAGNLKSLAVSSILSRLMKQDDSDVTDEDLGKIADFSEKFFLNSSSHDSALLDPERHPDQVAKLRGWLADKLQLSDEKISYFLLCMYEALKIIAYELKTTDDGYSQLFSSCAMADQLLQEKGLKLDDLTPELVTNKVKEKVGEYAGDDNDKLLLANVRVRSAVVVAHSLATVIGTLIGRGEDESLREQLSMAFSLYFSSQLLDGFHEYDQQEEKARKEAEKHNRKEVREGNINSEMDIVITAANQRRAEARRNKKKAPPTTVMPIVSESMKGVIANLKGLSSEAADRASILFHAIEVADARLTQIVAEDERKEVTVKQLANTLFSQRNLQSVGKALNLKAVAGNATGVGNAGELNSLFADANTKDIAEGLLNDPETAILFIPALGKVIDDSRPLAEFVSQIVQQSAREFDAFLKESQPLDDEAKQLLREQLDTFEPVLTEIKAGLDNSHHATRNGTQKQPVVAARR